MQSDLPHTLLKRTRQEDGGVDEHGGKKRNTVASAEVLRLQEEANRKMRERKAAKMRGETPYDVNELFK